MATKRIYFLGLPGMQPGTETNFFISSGQDAYKYPPVGEYIDVPDYVARDIINKYGGNVFTYSASLARDVKAGKVSFAREEHEGKVIVREVEKMSNEEILARAAEIQAAMEQEADENADSEPEVKTVEESQEEATEAVAEVEEKKTRRTRKSKAKE